MPRLSAILVLAFAAGAAADAPAAADLLRRAKAARRQGEKDLAEARRRILAERKALAGSLQDAYAALSAAGADAKAARDALHAARQDAHDAQRRAEQTSLRIRTIVAQAAACADAQVDASAGIAEMESALWRGFARRLERIEKDSRLALADQTVIARDGREQRVRVARLGAFAAYACGDSRETCGLLRQEADGRSRVVGAYVDDAHARALRADTLTHLPVDVDGTLIDRAPAEPKTLRTWLAAGGMFVIPILVVAALGVALVAERIAYLLRAKTPPPLIDKVLSALERDEPAAAREELAGAKTPAARVLRAGVEAAGKNAEQREAAMEAALLAEGSRLERSLSLLGALAGVAPLLGLLGTVSGMIATFDTISTAGTGNPRLLSGGISEALITTQLGLVVAIPLLLAHAWLRRWVERRESLLEYNAARVFGVRHAEEGQTS